jgi:hypothetical protein
MDQGFIQAIIARLRPDSSAPASTPAAKMPPGPQLRGWQLANQERQMNGEPPISYADWAKTATPTYGQ